MAQRTRSRNVSKRKLVNYSKKTRRRTKRTQKRTKRKVMTGGDMSTLAMGGVGVGVLALVAALEGVIRKLSKKEDVASGEEEHSEEPSVAAKATKEATEEAVVAEAAAEKATEKAAAKDAKEAEKAARDVADKEEVTIIYKKTEGKWSPIEGIALDKGSAPGAGRKLLRMDGVDFETGATNMQQIMKRRNEMEGNEYSLTFGPRPD